MKQSRSKARRIAIQKGETFPEMDIKEIEGRLGKGSLWADEHINILLSYIKELEEGKE